eukprot:TRINITY_DN123557_c0_g1_i1.p1 TRINITY_DN123557_c0_g1~~TRINITY_DN123557_c0_g1_i1.p1  ORF type:complete len:224 (+),score=77.01 TRINITY_DN123557_c0_g1_i1:96-767(+)
MGIAKRSRSVEAVDDAASMCEGTAQPADMACWEAPAMSAKEARMMYQDMFLANHINYLQAQELETVAHLEFAFDDAKHRIEEEIALSMGHSLGIEDADVEWQKLAFLDYDQLVDIAGAAGDFSAEEEAARALGHGFGLEDESGGSMMAIQCQGKKRRAPTSGLSEAGTPQRKPRRLMRNETDAKPICSRVEKAAIGDMEATKKPVAAIGNTGNMDVTVQLAAI